MRIALGDSQRYKYVITARAGRGRFEGVPCRRVSSPGPRDRGENRTEEPPSPAAAPSD
jgi:hypothetical protein